MHEISTPDPDQQQIVDNSPKSTSKSSKTNTYKAFHKLLTIVNNSGEYEVNLKSG